MSEKVAWELEDGGPGTAMLPARPTRYGQCDDTCTTDCGHCKGAGAPKVKDQGASELCAGCGEVAQGWASINRQRYCHTDDRRCYREAVFRDAFRPLADPPSKMSALSDHKARVMLAWIRGFDRDLFARAERSTDWISE